MEKVRMDLNLSDESFKKSLFLLPVFAVSSFHTESSLLILNDSLSSSQLLIG
jgi:hypothetical protein